MRYTSIWECETMKANKWLCCFNKLPNSFISTRIIGLAPCFCEMLCTFFFSIRFGLLIGFDNGLSCVERAEVEAQCVCGSLRDDYVFFFLGKSKIEIWFVIIGKFIVIPSSYSDCDIVIFGIFMWLLIPCEDV